MEFNLIAAIFFFFIGIAVLVKNTDSKEKTNIFWFCDFAPFLFAFGFFTGNIQFVKSIVNVGLFGQILTLITGVSMRFSEWRKGKLFNGKFYIAVETLIHLTAIIAIALTYNAAPKIESLWYSAMIIVPMFAATLIFAPRSENINALYYSELDINANYYSKINHGKGPVSFKLPFHTQLWMLYVFAISAITFLFQYALYKL